LDVLVNNAGIGKSYKPNPTLRQVFLDIYDANVAGIAVVIETFTDLLKKSAHPRIVNVSSSRGSVTRTLDPNSAPQRVPAYSISKAALNLLSVIYSQKTT